MSSPTQIRQIPEKFIDKAKEFADSRLEAITFDKKIFVYDGFGPEGQGFPTQEDFVSIHSTGGGDYIITMFPSTQLPTNVFNLKAKFIKNIVNYNQKPDDISSLIYSKEMPKYMIDRELDLRDKMIWFTQESIYGGANLEVDRDLAKFVIDSYEPQYDTNGVFSYAYLTLRKVQSYMVSSRDSEGNVSPWTFSWFKGSVQPINAKRRRRTFKSKPILWETIIKGSSGVALDMKITPNSSKWQVDVFLPIKKSTKVSFSPAWTIERAFIVRGLPHADQKSDYFFPYSWENINMEGDYMRASKDQDGQLDFYKSANGRYAFPSTDNYDGIAMGDDPDGSSIKDYPRYFGQKATWKDIVGIGAPNSDQLADYFYAKQKEIMNNVLPFSSTGIKSITESNDNVGGATLPRTQEQKNALWITYKEESYMLFDYVIANTDLTLIVNEHWLYSISSNSLNNIESKQKMLDFSNIESMPDYVGEYTPYIGSQKEKDNIDLLILGKLNNWMGESITERPPDFINKTFDFSPVPNEWDASEMKKYCGIYPNLGPLDIDYDDIIHRAANIGLSSTVAYTWGLIAEKSSLAMNYKNFTSLKGLEMSQDFFTNQNGAWVLENEWVAEELIIEESMRYYGGYEYTDEWFENSYEDSLTKGDIPCKTSILGFEFDYPPQTFVADNRKGQPNKAYTIKIFGSGNQESHMSSNIITELNKKLIANNRKEVIDIKTGEKITNHRYKKGDK